MYALLFHMISGVLFDPQKNKFNPMEINLYRRCIYITSPVQNQINFIFPILIIMIFLPNQNLYVRCLLSGCENLILSLIVIF